jgi:hypothetical protein
MRADGHDVTCCSSTRPPPNWCSATTPPGGSTRSPTTPRVCSRRSSTSARLQRVRRQADLVIDTTDLNVHQLKERSSRRSSTSGSTTSADRDRELRLQERAAARRRHRDGRAVPAEPALAGRSPAAHRPRSGRPRLRARTAVTSAFLDRSRRSARQHPALVPGGGAQLPHDRDRLHRWTSSLGGRRRGALHRFATAASRAHVAPRRRSAAERHRPAGRIRACDRGRTVR